MRKFFYILMMIFLSSCGQKNIEPAKEAKTLAPLEISKNDFDKFFLDGQSFSLPADYQDFEQNGIKLNEEEFTYQKMSKSGQQMANLKSSTIDIGATFKNTSSDPIDIENGKIIELYINNNNGKNKDFSIGGLKWGDSYQKASKSLKDIRTAEAIMNDEKTINYYTEKNYVSLYFKDDKLSSAAIFSKKFMRDEAYKNGEFVIFGQNVSFPLTIRDLEQLLGSDINIDQDLEKLDPGLVVTTKIYSPLLNDIEDHTKVYGLDIEIKNTGENTISPKDGQIISIKSDKSSDISVGNLYVGASIDELKNMDKKNQNPGRLKIDWKIENNLVKFVFNAENETDYIFHTDEDTIKLIRIINKKEQ